MKRLVSTLLLLTALALTHLALAAPESVLYNGTAGALTVAPWGAGGGQESAEVFLFGGHSLKVTTLDPYQGARVAFATPVALNAEAGRVFEITIRRGTATLHYDPRTVPGAASPQPGGGPGAGYPGGPPSGMGYPGGRGGFGRRRGNRGQTSATGGAAGNAAAPLIPPITALRLAFAFADGRQADILRPIPAGPDPALGEGWYSVTVPLSLLKLPIGADAALKSVTVGGDHYGVFYIGRIRLATDTAPITAGIDGAPTAVPGKPLPLSARVEGGLSDLSYEWDFGNGETGTGLSVAPRYPRGGHEYTVTLTVSDLDGLKKPVTATKTITVPEDAPQTQPGGPGGFPGQPPFPGGPPGGFPGPPQGNAPGDQE